MINSCTKPFKLMIFNINPILKIYFLCDADNSVVCPFPELFWTPSISHNLFDRKWPLLPENASLCIAVHSLNFFERHVSLDSYLSSKVTENDRFFARKCLRIFLNIMLILEEFLCVFFYTSPCSAREAGLRPASLAPRLEKPKWAYLQFLR